MSMNIERPYKICRLNNIERNLDLYFYQLLREELVTRISY